MRLPYLFAVLLLSSAAKAQDRINVTIPTIEKTPIWSLTSAKGWIKNSEGQWIEGRNKIQNFNNSIADKASWENEGNARGLDNFASFELRKIDIDGYPFLLLTKNYIDDKWRLEFTKKGWSPAPTTKYVVFKEFGSEIIPGPEEKRFMVPLYFAGTLPYSADVLQKIALEISSVKTKEILEAKTTDANMNVIYVEPDEKTCRFFFQRQYGVGAFANDFKPERLSGSELMIFAPNDFYYECPKSAMAGLIKELLPQTKAN